MINLGPSWELEHWPDNWTAVTVDGKKSAQFEETLLYADLAAKNRGRSLIYFVIGSITETGVEVLTGAPKKDGGA